MDSADRAEESAISLGYKTNFSPECGKYDPSNSQNCPYHTNEGCFWKKNRPPCVHDREMQPRSIRAQR